MSIPAFRDGSQGVSNLAWSTQLQQWLCGDSEGSILVKSQADTEHSSTKLEGDPITAVVVHPTKSECAVAEGDVVSVRSLDNLDSVIQSTVFKSNLAITSVSYDHSGRFLFVSSLEPDVAILSMERGSAVDQKISSANLGVRTIALSADSKYIAVVDVDGTVCIHSLSYTTEMDGTCHISGRTMESQSSSLVPKTVSRATGDVGCKVSWFPLPKEKVLLAVPSNGGSIVVLTPTAEASDRRWSESFLLSTDGPSHHAHDLNLVEFSPNGRYLASADLSGGVVVWAFDAASPSRSSPLHALSPVTTPLHDLVWGRNAADNYLIATTAADWFEFPDVVAGGARPALLPGTVASPQPAKVAKSPVASTATEYLAHTATEEMSEEDALIAAAMAAEAQYMTQQQGSPAPKTSAASALRSPALAAPAAPAVRSPAATRTDAAPKKRLTKVNVAASAKDEDDDLFDGDDAGSVTGKAVPAGAAVAEAAAAAPVADSTSIAAIKHKAGLSAANKRLIDDEALDMDDDDDLDRDEDIDLEEAGIAGADERVPLAKLLELAKGGSVLPTAPARKLQAPFQPSSTKFDEKQRRYLVWNKVGSIVLREEKVEVRIEIRFNNTGGSNRNESFADRSGFVMGALSHEGAVFATEPEPLDLPKSALRDPEAKKEGPGSTIYYHAFPGQKHMGGANESFRWTLADGEAALAVAVGRGWIAVASSANLLYVFNSAGVPTMTVALRGPVLALSGCEHLLGVLYHGHTIECDVFDITFQSGCRTRRVVSGLPLPLPRQVAETDGTAPGSAQEQGVEWVGFDVDNHVLTVLDKRGMLWGLINCADWQWVPLLDIHAVRKSVEHTYWPTCVRGGKLVYVLLNGESRPAIYPQPVVATKALRIPVPSVRDGKDADDKYKERMHTIMYSTALTAHMETALAEVSTAATAGKITSEDPVILTEKLGQSEFDADKAVLAYLQEACQRQRIPLALSLALQIRTEKTLMAAITIANHFGRTTVAEALDAILQEKQEQAALLQAQQEGAYVQQQPATQDFNYTSSEYAPEEENLFTENAPTFDDYSPAAPVVSTHNEGGRKVNFATTAAPAGGSLSSKVSAKPAATLFGAANKAQVVSPAVTVSGAEGADKPHGVRNPFAVTSSGTTPQKRKNVFDGIQDMKASPSPKKPTLNRQSSFSQQARQQRLSDKRIL